MRNVLKHHYLNQGLLYTQIPDAPFSSGVVITMDDLSVAGQLRPVDVGNPSGGIDMEFVGAFTDGLSINSISDLFIGSAAVPFRVVNRNTDVVIGVNTKGIATIDGDQDYWEIYGRNIANPFIINAALAGQNGLNWTARTGGTSLKLQNIVFRNTASSGCQINSTSGAYRDIVLAYYRAVGTGNEGIYLGNTGTTFAVFDSIDIQNCYTADTQWDPIQIGHCTDLYINKSTFYNGGIANTSSQDHLVQIVDTNGLIENCIFDHAPRICNLSCHGVTFRNCLFRYYDATERGFIGRTDNLSYYPTARHNGSPILFDNCYFIAETGAIVSTIMAVQERIANVEFLNCKFSDNIVEIMLDQRVAGFTNTLTGTIGTNGNTLVSGLTAPTYTNHTVSDYANHGKLTNPFWYALGMGYLTPTAA